MNKKLFLGGLVGFLALGIASCNPTSNPSTDNGSSEGQHEPVIKEAVEISMWVKSDTNSPLCWKFQSSRTKCYC